MNNELVTQEDQQQGVVWVNPEDRMEQAQEWATSLMARVDNTMDKMGKPVYYSNLGGNKYLRVDAWEMIGKFDGVSAETEWEKELFDAEGNIRGYRVKVKLVNKETGGAVGGGAVMQCLMDSNVTKGQYTQDGKESAALSMAQTRATSKAFRLNYSFVAILGGYESLPAEELTDEMIQKGKIINQQVTSSPTVQHAESLGATVVESKPKPTSQQVIKTPVTLEDYPNVVLGKEVTASTPAVNTPQTTYNPISESKPSISMPVTPDEFVCPLHGKAFTKRDGKFGIYWSHPEEGYGASGWCNLNDENFKPEFIDAWAQFIETNHGYDVAAMCRAEASGKNIGWWLDKIEFGEQFSVCSIVGCEARADIEVNGSPSCLVHESELLDG